MLHSCVAYYSIAGVLAVFLTWIYLTRHNCLRYISYVGDAVLGATQLLMRGYGHIQCVTFMTCTSSTKPTYVSHIRMNKIYVF